MRCCIAVAALWLSLTPAIAADAAQSRAIGYSTDGKYFAFEQYGVQDGSGFPYWDIFIIDLEKDAWAGGSPFRVVIENEEAKLAQSRQLAYDKANAELARLNITEPAELLVSNPATEIVANRASVRFNAYYTQHAIMQAGPDDGMFELNVKAIDLPVPASCPDPDFIPKGLEVTITDRNLKTTRTLHKDTAIPETRFCPLYYDVEAVYTRTGYDPPNHSVVLIGVYSRGFEVEDRSYIAIPFDLSD